MNTSLIRPRVDKLSTRQVFVLKFEPRSKRVKGKLLPVPPVPTDLHSETLSGKSVKRETRAETQVPLHLLL